MTADPNRPRELAKQNLIWSNNLCSNQSRGSDKHCETKTVPHHGPGAAAGPGVGKGHGKGKGGWAPPGSATKVIGGIQYRVCTGDAGLQ